MAKTRFLSLEHSAEHSTLVISPNATADVRRQFAKDDWRLLPLNQDEAAIQGLETLKRKWSKVDDAERADVWQKGWMEAFDQYHRDGTLVAGFTNPTTLVNVEGTYFGPFDPNFEVNFQALIRTMILEEYFGECTTFVEFGAGTGINLLAAALKLPSARIIGSDFVPAAVDLHKAIATRTGLPIESYVFDMRDPSNPEQFPAGSSVLTYGSVEQLGNNFRPFLNFLLKIRPKVVVHVETDSSFLLNGNLPDFISKWYAELRGYPDQLQSHLSAMEREKLIRVITAERSIAHPGLTPGNNIIVWVPTDSFEAED